MKRKMKLWRRENSYKTASNQLRQIEQRYKSHRYEYWISNHIKNVRYGQDSIELVNYFLSQGIRP